MAMTQQRSGETPEHAVVIAGAGPTGMMLAAELALAGIDVAIVERRSERESLGARAGGLHARTIEIFDQRGIADRFLSQGQIAQVQRFAAPAPLDISDFPTRHNYGLGLWQNRIEQILAGWVAEWGVPLYREREVSGFTQDDHGIDVHVTGGAIRARYLVGCDGGRSVIRKKAGIDFAGFDPTISSLIAEVEMTGEPELGIRRDQTGIHAMGRLDYEIRDGQVVFADSGPVRVTVTEPQVGTAPPTLDDLRRAIIGVWGTDFGLRSATFVSRFTDASRQAATYRKGRVLLAGDAAHVHSPAGGQGLNIGVHDAVNLGWKLAQVIRGTSPDELLDTYHAERHPVAARIVRHTMAQVALMRPSDARIDALRDTVAELMQLDQPRKLIAGLLSGLDVRYDLGEGHPLLGRRMPDLDLETAAGPVRVFTLLHRARPVLLNFGEQRGFDIAAPWRDRVDMIEAAYSGRWELPILGDVPAVDAALIRPDGHVAWVGAITDSFLPDALTTWFGPPHP